MSRLTLAASNQSRNATIEEAAAEIQGRLNLFREESIRDPLTSLYNRRFLSEFLSRELMVAERKGEILGVIAIDIDHFKRINDTFGHDTGDKVLIIIANILIENIRGSDIACRVGGEEFTIVMPGADLEAILDRSERIRSTFAQSDIINDSSHIGFISISLGVSVFPEDGKDAESLLRLADQALYQVKRTGRNQIVRISGIQEVAGSNPAVPTNK